MMVPGSCAQVFSLLSHHRDLNSACVNCQADVQDQEEVKWQCAHFREWLGDTSELVNTRIINIVYALADWQQKKNEGEGKIFFTWKIFKWWKRTSNRDILNRPAIWQLRWRDEEVKRVSAVLAWLFERIQETQVQLFLRLFLFSVMFSCTLWQALLREYLWRFALCSAVWYFWSWANYSDPKH